MMNLKHSWFEDDEPHHVMLARSLMYKILIRLNYHNIVTFCAENDDLLILKKKMFM